jgi:hypothetical protein
MHRIEDILARPGCNWRAFHPPLEPAAIAAAVARIRRSLPDGLLELYRLCNSGQGSLPFEPWVFVLWGIDFVAETREDEHYRKYYDDFVFFGSNGAGEYFGLDPAGRVFYMDAYAGEQSIIECAQSFEQFIVQLGFRPPGGIPDLGEDAADP